MASNTNSRCPWRIQSTKATIPDKTSNENGCKEWNESGRCSQGPRCRRVHFVTCMNDCKTDDLIMTGLSPRTWKEAQVTPHPATLTPGEKMDTRIMGYRVVASYSWKNCEVPTILVPGTLPTWTSPQLPFHSAPEYLRKSGYCKSVTTNGIWQAVFASLLECGSGYDMSTTELACDSHSLNHLFDFVMGGKRFRHPETLTYRRFDVDVIENTMLLNVSPTNEYISTPLRDLKALTTNFSHDEKLPCRHRTSCHHRVVRYKIGGLRILLDFEVDANVPDPKSFGFPPPPRSPWELAKPAIDCTAVQSPTEQSSTGTRVVKSSNFRIGNVAGYDSPPHAAIALVNDLPRASQHEKWVISGAWRLYFTGTQQAIIGYHCGPKVLRFEGRNVHKEIDLWGSSHRTQLRRLVMLVKELQVASRELGGKCALIFSEEDGKRELKMYKRIGQELALPEGVKEKCWREKHWRTL